MIPVRNWLLPTATLFCLGVANMAAAKTDRYVGYYYPAPVSNESYCARADPIAKVDKRRRIGFIIGIKAGMAAKAYPPEYTMFAKGGQAHKMIIVAKHDGYLSSIYRVRALLADLTTNARTTPVFEKSGVPENLTFLDLAVMLGFKSITVSDGDKFAHQIALKNGSLLACETQSEQD